MASQQPNLPLHSQILSVAPTKQEDSPLFAVLPPEIREQIFSYALSDYPDPNPQNHYEEETYYSRPSYFAPRRTDTALLQTCRAVYAETWFLPFMLREQVHWLSSNARAPPDYRGASGLRQDLKRIEAQLGEGHVEIAHLRAFAQMFMLEENKLRKLMKVRGLHPRVVTLTIRHTDWWYWEDDEPLRFEAHFLRSMVQMLPASVREFHIELETTARRREQVEYIAERMCERWFFERRDGPVLWADASGASCEVSEWRGPSTWGGKRWTRDETEEGVIDYHIISVPFRLEHVVERGGGRISDRARSNFKRHFLNDNEMTLDAAVLGISRVAQSTDGESGEEEFEDGSGDDESEDGSGAH